MLVDGDVSKLKTADCRQWLATSDEIQNLVKDRYGWLDDEKTLLEMCGHEQDEVDYINNIVAQAAKPKNWKRQRKFKLGSETDQNECGYSYLFPGEGVVRQFNLRDTEIAVMILEQNGKLSYLNDLSD
jgi:hypothetical protein